MAIRTEKKSGLQESQRDTAHLQPDKGELDLPDPKDIPGQEHIHVPPAGILDDTTISSDDEEGKSVLDDTTDEDVIQDRKDAEPFPSGTYPVDEDDRNIEKNRLDDKDTEGDLLNEASDDLSGEDLDVPGAEEDDLNEELGEEDEENNSYSFPDQE